ncbi:MAG TPA: sigma-54 dependent transcriptional regulator [Gemmataceae bacterium]|nr:sigma-54 dependent transcriptional regulator [Gemmataceae bacterium]
MATLLVIDDEPNVLYSVEKSLRSDTLAVVTASTARQGIDVVRRQPPDAVILDVRLADMNGLDAFDLIRQTDPRLPVIVITAYATTETAIEAMKRGAFEYLVKPVDFRQLREIVHKAVELSRLRHVPAVFDEELPGDLAVDRIVGRCAAMQEVYKAIGRAAPLDVPVLIVGASGTGKELVARALYQHSQRAGKPFLAINCAAIPEALLESELFGHERGAFTGADRRRIGKFEQANGGTIFLDEIGDMTSATQPKVLRLLQEQQFERLGSNETIQTDVRVIAATNHNLEELVATGRLRQDLYYRLKVFTIELPPLHERPDDVPLLVEHFIRVGNRELGKQVTSVGPEAMRLLQEHDWPGNVRELQSAIKYALVQAAGEVLTPDCLPDNVRSGPAPARPPQPVPEGGTLDVAGLVGALLRAGEPEIYRKVCLEVDRVVMEVVLRHVKGNQVQASELLGISRTTLRAKLRALGMAVEKQLLPEPGQDE